jgi:hypothetical protein
MVPSRVRAPKPQRKQAGRAFARLALALRKQAARTRAVRHTQARVPRRVQTLSVPLPLTVTKSVCVVHGRHSRQVKAG